MNILMHVPWLCPMWYTHSIWKALLALFYHTVNSFPTVSSSVTKISVSKTFMSHVTHKLNVAHPLVKFNFQVWVTIFKLLFFHSSPEYFLAISQLIFIFSTMIKNNNIMLISTKFTKLASSTSFTWGDIATLIFSLHQHEEIYRHFCIYRTPSFCICTHLPFLLSWVFNGKWSQTSWARVTSAWIISLQKQHILMTYLVSWS